MPISQQPKHWPLKGQLRAVDEPSKMHTGPEQQQHHPLRTRPGERGSSSLTGPMESTAEKHQSLSMNIREGTPCTDRMELMERIKRGESPKWVPSAALWQEYLKENGVSLERRPSNPSNPSISPPQIGVDPGSKSEPAEEPSQSGYDIGRPPSAMHAGDFKSRSSSFGSLADEQKTHRSSQPHAGGSAGRNWHVPPSTLASTEPVAPWDFGGLPRPKISIDSTPLGSFSSSNYILKKPTTPLIQQSNNTDLDSSTRDPSASPEKGTRRVTLSPQALQNWQFASRGSVGAASPNDLARSYRREASFPQSHRARRSMTSAWSIQQSSSPPTPAFLKSRRTSFTWEASPRQRASMVGSYEESILHGRMSTAPSKPFDFYAHIGALGRGTKPKMPAQIVVPFQAVFYDWPSNARGSSMYDEPAPYVGEIDLGNPTRPSISSDNTNHSPASAANISIIGFAPSKLDHNSHHPDTVVRPRMNKQKDQTTLPKGSYRIPEQGQIQVVVKNPYKTALKLFLVAYDLAGMEAGQKTFVRQRYYSAGPIFERPVATGGRASLPSDNRKKTLRYLIHLKICCPTKGRYYLYGNIRVVFANRVPDDKEYLTKEVQEPVPRYSLWKPDSETSGASIPATKPAGNGASRRRSLGFNDLPSGADTHRCQSYTASAFPYADVDAPPVPPIPFHIPPLTQPTVNLVTRNTQNGMDVAESKLITAADGSPTYGSQNPTNGGHLSSDSGDSDSYVKLSKDDAGYGGSFSRTGTPTTCAGLLSRQLQKLGVQNEFGRQNAADMQ